MVDQPHDKYLKPLLTELLKRIETDDNEHVQQAACKALTTLQVIQLNPTTFYSLLGILILFLMLGRGRLLSLSLTWAKSWRHSSVPMPVPAQKFAVPLRHYRSFGRISRQSTQ